MGSQHFFSRGGGSRRKPALTRGCVVFRKEGSLSSAALALALVLASGSRHATPHSPQTARHPQPAPRQHPADSLTATTQHPDSDPLPTRPHRTDPSHRHLTPAPGRPSFRGVGVGVGVWFALLRACSAVSVPAEGLCAVCWLSCTVAGGGF